MSLYPLAKQQAGNHAWSIMHHRVSLYPSSPTDKEKERMKAFLYECMKGVAELCSDCKSHIREYLSKNPIKPALESKDKLSLYLCNFHNSVNQRQGKEVKDCKNILRPKEEAECKDCRHKVQKDSQIKHELDLKDTLEKFKDVSKKIFFQLCDRYRLPHPTIKFHECPSDSSTSCTSMWLHTETKDVVERPIVYLHPNKMGLRTIFHEFIHYARQMNKDSLGAIDEHKVEGEAQALLTNEFPFDRPEKEYIKGETIVDNKPLVVMKDTLPQPSYLSKFPMASQVYNKHLYNIKRRDFTKEETHGDWVFDLFKKKPEDELAEEESQQQQRMVGRNELSSNTHALSFLDGLYSPFAALFGIKSSDMNTYNTPTLISNAALSLMKTYLSPVGALLLSTVTSFGIYGAMAFTRNSLSYGDKLLMNNFGANLLWSAIDYTRPENKTDVLEGAMLLGNAVSQQQWNVLPQLLLGETLQSFVGETSTASPLSSQRNMQRAALGGGSSGSRGSGIGSSSSGTRKEIRAYQREMGLESEPDNPLAVRNVQTGAGRGPNPADISRGRSVNTVPFASQQISDNSVVIPSDYEEEYESAFGMHVSDGRPRVYDDVEIIRDDDVVMKRRNTIKDVFETDPTYDNFNDVYDEAAEVGIY